MAKFPAQPVYARQGGGVGVAPPPAAGVISPPPSGPVPPVPGGGGGGMSPPPLQNDTGSRTMSPALGGGGGTLAHQKQQQQQQQQESFASSGSDLLLPTQLKVKVNCNGNYVTLVVAFNITYQSLIDRIDAKLNRFTNASLGKGNLKLRYQDEDGDFVTIESDDDIQIAISEWREGMRGTVAGSVGEIELFCVGETS
ncbi:hypothetical protein VTK73DRAFT_1627 [Phialemonium thermophilum]|uniref:PB1 domain-containing protein n=1 Tax=Phialemonium thermophilum TaxID=223376 RepID=A0ABR3VT91_9PEZI